MANEETKKKPNDLDKSIDLGLDQFGRFARTRWFLLVILAIVIWYSIVYMVPQLRPPTPSVLFQVILQISFALIFVGVQFFMWFFLMGRPRMYWVLPGETGVNFDDYKGNPEVLEAARRIVSLVTGVKEFEKMGGKPVRGLLLSGPPGTGKSYLAQCISTEAGVPFGYISAASLRGIFMGMDVLAIKNVYNKARRFAREYGGCIVFMDELDAIGASRAAGATMGMGMGGMMGGMGNGTGGLNELLMQLDPPNIDTGWFKKLLRLLGLYHGRAQTHPVLTIGATNIPETLDTALLRPGRFDRKIHVAPPTDKYRPEVVQYYLDKVKHDPNISIAAISQRLVEYTPVRIKHVINEAVIIAHFDDRETITYKDITEAQDVEEYGLRQESELTPVERRRLAYHEAGHTVASYYLMDRYFPAYVTLHMRGDVAGAAAFAHQRPKETIITHNKQDILADIQISMASRAAEELFLDVNLSGVTGDFASATREATLYITAFGMDGTFTSALAFSNTNPLTGGNPFALPGVAERTEKLLQSQFEAVKQLFRDHSEAVIAVAEALIERNELVAEEIKQLIDEGDARRVARRVISEFEPLLEAGRNGNGSNGHALVNGHNNGKGALPAPRVDSSPLNSVEGTNSPLMEHDNEPPQATGDNPYL
ncbi:ATPase [Reticulibacter mediterranei]|uniref:ATPase n=1 Tax=Reticulibacter mediterranei TaxID=2778369 RepID=A0A8J3IC14_9CHLR|nr:AAA family ATPase [Reticulibacter mediterranei]GHO92639.1 ATPase [Reticulibacter mediterranei]